MGMVVFLKERLCEVVIYDEVGIFADAAVRAHLLSRFCSALCTHTVRRGFQMDLAPETGLY